MGGQVRSCLAAAQKRSTAAAAAARRGSGRAEEVRSGSAAAARSGRAEEVRSGSAAAARKGSGRAVRCAVVRRLRRRGAWRLRLLLEGGAGRRGQSLSQSLRGGSDTIIHIQETACPIKEARPKFTVLIHDALTQLQVLAETLLGMPAYEMLNPSTPNSKTSISLSIFVRGVQVVAIGIPYTTT